MGVHNAGYAVKERGRQTFTVGAVSGDYASERLTFGVVGSGVVARSFLGGTVVIEADASGAPCPAGVTVEVWVPRVVAADKSADQFTDADYAFAGFVVVPAGTARALSGVNSVMYGSGSFAFGAYPGFQVRVKSGGSLGSVTISATGW